MGRFERNNWATSAHVVIRERIKTTPAYTTAFTAVVDQACSEICAAIEGTTGAETVACMRELGGFTAVVNRVIETVIAADPTLSENAGSQLIETSLGDVLRGEVVLLVEAVRKQVHDQYWPWR